eukprot:13548588-Alexandrium_andersonii.AAC.1
MPAPTTADWPALLRLARYLVLPLQPRAVYSFRWQDEGAGNHAFATPTLLGASALGGPRAE